MRTHGPSSGLARSGVQDEFHHAAVLFGDFVFFVDEEVAKDGIDPGAGSFGSFDDDEIAITRGDEFVFIDVNGEGFFFAFEQNVDFDGFVPGIEFEIEELAVVGQFFGKPALDRD